MSVSIVLVVFFFLITRSCNDLVSFFALITVPLHSKLQRGAEKRSLRLLHCFVPVPGMHLLQDLLAVDFLLPGGAGKASLIERHLARALDGVQELALAGL